MNPHLVIRFLQQISQHLLQLVQLLFLFHLLLFSEPIFFNCSFLNSTVAFLSALRSSGDFTFAHHLQNVHIYDTYHIQLTLVLHLFSAFYSLLCCFIYFHNIHAINTYTRHIISRSTLCNCFRSTCVVMCCSFSKLVIFTYKRTGKSKIEAKLRPSWKLPSFAAPSPKKHTATLSLP